MTSERLLNLFHNEYWVLYLPKIIFWLRPCKGLGTCYSDAYMSRLKKQRFTNSDNGRETNTQFVTISTSVPNVTVLCWEVKFNVQSQIAVMNIFIS